MCKMRMCLTVGPCAIRFMSLQLFVCTVNGTVVRGHSKWEAGENRLENKRREERLEWGKGLKAKDGEKERRIECCR